METPPNTPIPQAKLETYEDCLALIGQTKTSPELSTIQSAMSRLEDFFKTRAEKKRASNPNDASASVKKAITTQRTWKKFEPATPMAPANESIFSQKA
jgi:hypothetical protein